MTLILTNWDLQGYHCEITDIVQAEFSFCLNVRESDMECLILSTETTHLRPPGAFLLHRKADAKIYLDCITRDETETTQNMAVCTWQGENSMVAFLRSNGKTLMKARVNYERSNYDR